MDLAKILETSEMVLVAIGEEFQDSSLDIYNNKDDRNIFEEYTRLEHLKKREEDRVDQAYSRLNSLLKNKDYFLVTMCCDDKIYDAGFEKNRIVAPCGSYHSLQCEDVCTNEIYPTENFKKDIDEGKEPLCPHCRKRLVINRIGVPRYSEEGYLKQWEVYTGWLQGSLNKKICILELGVGLDHPSVIRWPAEKIAYFNQKATLIRVHSFLYQIPEELKERGYSIQEDPVIFLTNQIV
ncbi:MAG: hypothetical protein IJP31_10915 [Lachnospiraceae bacterium]|nr:hypothetical protein [Lachnospiraceae bacterium]